MRENWLVPVTGLIREGRFGKALETLRDCKSKVDKHSRDLYTLLLAENLQRTGENAESTRLAQALLRSRGLSTSLQTRCHIVLGDSCRSDGRLPEALQHLQKAIATAEEGGDIEQLCWAQLRLIAAVAQGSGVGAAVALVTQLRRRVAQLGDPHVTATLHELLAEVEAKRGFLESAKHHIRIGQSLLERLPNVWLKGLFANLSSLICYFESDIECAISHAKYVAQCADASGHIQVRTAAVANLAMIYLYKGELDLAERYVHDGLRVSHEVRENYSAILETYAQLRLARQEWSDCEALLDQIRTMGSHAPVLHWAELWSFRTRIRLLQHQGRWAEAGETASHAMKLAADRSDRPLGALLRLLKAETLMMMGRHEEAAALIIEAGSDCDDFSLDTIAEIERVKGKAFARLGHSVAASHHYQRALRILAVTGNVYARADVFGDYEEGSARLPAPPSSHQPASVLSGLLPEQTWIPASPDDRSPSGVTEAQRASWIAVETAALFFDLAGKLELLGHEALSLLVATQCANIIALIARNGAHGPEIIACWGCDRENASTLDDLMGCLRLRLGVTRGRELELLVCPKTDLAGRSAVLAVQKLLKAAVALEAARQEQRQRTALWPIEPLQDTEHGVFAADQMVELLTTAQKIGAIDIPVLLTGETGTGKEVLARVIHRASTGAACPFLPFSCTSVPREMLDSQLFGHKRGAFTGAHDHFSGVIRAAEGGTLFLDEIGELGPDVQPKLLRFLESGEIHPLGEPRPLKVEVRVIAATNANLEQLVADGKFREDLFYRLNVIRLRVPPLRERREEIPLLVRHFLERYGEEFHKENLRVAEETMEYLLLYAWPGNVRQLANEVRRLAALAEPGAVLAPEHLSAEIKAGRRTVPAGQRTLAANEVVVRLDQPLAAAIEHLERAMLPYAIRSFRGSTDMAAKALGISRKGLYLKRQRLSLGPLEAH